MRLVDRRGDVVVLACAVSAGVHGALAPRHFGEGTGAGGGFVIAALAPAVLTGWLTARPTSRVGLVAALAALAGLLASYGLAATTGLPPLHPGPEPVDGLALATKAVEAVGLLAATSLLMRPVAVRVPQPKGRTP